MSLSLLDSLKQQWWKTRKRKELKLLNTFHAQLHLERGRFSHWLQFRDLWILNKRKQVILKLLDLWMTAEYNFQNLVYFLCILLVSCILSLYIVSVVVILSIYVNMLSSQACKASIMDEDVDKAGIKQSWSELHNKSGFISWFVFFFFCLVLCNCAKPLYSRKTSIKIEVETKGKQNKVWEVFGAFIHRCDSLMLQCICSLW